MLEFSIEADSFMRNMNRVLVGTMLEVAPAGAAVDDFARAARGRAARGGRAAPPPAHGLYLESVGYDVAAAAARLIELSDARAVRRRGRARLPGRRRGSRDEA